MENNDVLCTMYCVLYIYCVDIDSKSKKNSSKNILLIFKIYFKSDPNVDFKIFHFVNIEKDDN